MKTTTLGLIGLVIAAITLQPATAAEQYRFIGEDRDGNIVMIDLPDYDPNADHGSSACPAPVPCVNGPHVRDGVGYIIHGFVLPLTGAYSSTLIDTTTKNVRTFGCVFNNNGGVACQGQGTFPAFGATFYQLCAFGAATGGCYMLHY